MVAPVVFNRWVSAGTELLVERKRVVWPVPTGEISMYALLLNDCALLTHLCKRQFIDSVIDGAGRQHRGNNTAFSIPAGPRFHAKRCIVMRESIGTVINITVTISMELEIPIGNCDDREVGSFLGPYLDHLGDGREVELIARLVLRNGDRHGELRAWYRR